MSNKREVHDFVSQNHDAIRELADNLWRRYRNRGGYRGQMITVYDDPNYYVAFAAVKLYVENLKSTQHSNGAEPPEIFCNDICEYCQNNQLGNDSCVECSCGDSEHEEYIHFVGRKLRHC